MCPIKYHTMIQDNTRPEKIRLQLVQHAKEHGIKPTARLYKTTVRTVRKWLRRFDGSLESLRSRSRRPHTSPNRIPVELEQKIIALRKKMPGWGAARLKRDFGLQCSEKAISRLLAQQRLIQPRRRRHKVKNDLRAIKQRWRLFQQIDIDTKHLYDIPEYWEQMTKLKLPKFLYTARDVVSGLAFISFSEECSASAACVFAERILSNLQACGVRLEECIIQTDNGSEFIGSWLQRGPSPFTRIVEERFHARHHTIPPAAHTFQSDVETFHNLIEREFFIIERFSSRMDFLAKAYTYQIWFNYARRNSYKAGRYPMEIVRERDSSVNPRLGLVEPVFLESLLPCGPAPPCLPPSPKRGYHVPTLP